MGIRVANLTKSFGDSIVIENLSFALPDRGLFRISGPSGVGKTTLLRIISGLDKGYSGSVERTGEVSFLFQEHRLFPWLSALDNVVVAAFSAKDELSVKASADALRTLGFDDGELNLRPAQLSGGMKQRVSLARAFARQSDILILDEPTKELDSALVNTVKRMMIDASMKKLVIVVTHDGALDDANFDGVIPL